MNVFLDLETIPTQSAQAKALIAASVTPPGTLKKAESIAEWEEKSKPGAIDDAWRKTSFDGALGHIVCASFAIDDQPTEVVWDESWTNEAGIVSELFSRLTAAHKAAHGALGTYIGHNIVGFDLRFLFQRAVVLGIAPPGYIPFQAKPWGDRVYDTMTQWAGVGQRVSLDKLCRTLGIATKGAEIGEEIDGSMVWDFVQAGKIDKVATYCAGDVDRVRQVWRRMTFA